MFETVGLGVIFFVVLILPFRVRIVEQNLGLFLFVMGAIAVTVTSSWKWHLVEEALVTPLPITGAVLVAGSIVYILHHRLQAAVRWVSDRISLRPLLFFVVVVLGFVSSIISAIIAALFLVTVLELLPLDRRCRVNVTIIACFAIGIGAVLTPLGEPLSTIAISKLEGEPHNAGFFFLLDLLGSFVVPGVLAMGLLTLTPLVRIRASEQAGSEERGRGSYWEVLVWVLKVFIFVMALVLLGESFRVLIDKYFIRLAPEILYWINTVSAVLDNATLAAAEVGPSLSVPQIKAVLISLMVSGGMLIPGNIPNIIAADRLNIGMREWASLAIPLGAAMLAVCFVVLFYVI